MAYRPPRTLAELMAREDLYSTDHRPVAALLAAAAKTPARHPELGPAWGKLAAHLYYSDELIDALGATAPAAALRAAAAGIAEHTAEIRAQLLAAAIELGDEPGFRAVRGAMNRLVAVEFSGSKSFKHAQIAKFTSEKLLVAAAIRALRRVRIPPVDADGYTVFYDRRLFWALVSLVAVAGGEGAAEALEAAVVAAGDDAELRDRVVKPRLEAEKQREHVKAALARLAGERTEALPPLPFAPSAASVLPATGAGAKPGRSPKKPASIDPNLHFALLQALAAAKKLTLPPMNKKGPQRMSRKVRQELLAIPIPPAFAAQLVKLDWSAGMAVQFALFPYWSGEDDVFTVAHLHHLEDLVALEEIYLELAVSNLDLAPLSGMPRLKTLTLRTQVASLAPLLDLPALAKVRLAYDDTDANRAVVAELGRRGVKLDRPL